MHNIQVIHNLLHRTYKSWRKIHSNPARSVIDGELVWNFLHLSLNEKMEVCFNKHNNAWFCICNFNYLQVSKKIGTKIEELIDDLSDIQKCTAYF